MNQGSYFGAYRQGFKTMPDNAYEMMTAPTRQMTSAVSDTIGKLANAYTGYQAQQAGTEAFQQGAAAQYQGLQSTSQATGVPVNAELANQYMNIGNMSPQEQAAFQASLNQEAQRMQYLNTVNLQNRLLQNNSFTQDYTARAMGAPFIPSGITTNTGVPASNMSLPMGAGGIDASLFPRVNQPRVSPMGFYSNY